MVVIWNLFQKHSAIHLLGHTGKVILKIKFRILRAHFLNITVL